MGCNVLYSESSFFCSYLETFLQLSATCSFDLCWLADSQLLGPLYHNCLWKGYCLFLFKPLGSIFILRDLVCYQIRGGFSVSYPISCSPKMFCKLFETSLLGDTLIFFYKQRSFLKKCFISPLLTTPPDLPSLPYQPNFVFFSPPSLSLFLSCVKTHQVQFKVGNLWKFILRIYLRMDHE